MNQRAIPAGISQSVTASISIFMAMKPHAVCPMQEAQNGPRAAEEPVTSEDAFLCKKRVGDL
jgi:hypothetical protein